MDIKFERNGVQKMAQERFKNDLVAVGWTVVEDTPKEPVKKGRPKKEK